MWIEESLWIKYEKSCSLFPFQFFAAVKKNWTVLNLLIRFMVKVRSQLWINKHISRFIIALWEVVHECKTFIVRQMAAHSFLLMSMYVHIRRSKVYTFTRKHFGLSVCWFHIYRAFTNDSFINLNSSSWSTGAFHEGIRRSGGLPPDVLNFGNRWRRVISFTPRPL